MASNGGIIRNVLPLDGFYGMVRIDGFALLFKSIFLVAAALAIAISTRFLDIEGEQHGEYYALVLFATVGMMFLGCGYDLISLYISLELMALTFYVLVAFTKREKRSNEAAMKYFLLGAFSSGILLYGMSPAIRPCRFYEPRRHWTQCCRHSCFHDAARAQKAEQRSDHCCCWE